MPRGEKQAVWDSAATIPLESGILFLTSQFAPGVLVGGQCKDLLSKHDLMNFQEPACLKESCKLQDLRMPPTHSTQQGCCRTIGTPAAAAAAAAQ